MVEAIELEGRPFGEDAGDEQRVLEVWVLFCSSCEVCSRHLLVAEISHSGDFWLRDV